MATTLRDVYVTPRGYEFDDIQNQLLARLTRTMRFVGVTTVILGLALFVVGLGISAQVFHGARVGLLALIAGAWPTGLPGILFLIIGYATLRASADFAAITQTRGKDMLLLMDALQALSESYRTQLWFAAVGICLAGVFVASFFRA